MMRSVPNLNGKLDNYLARFHTPGGKPHNQDKHGRRKWKTGKYKGQLKNPQRLKPGAFDDSEIVNNKYRKLVEQAAAKREQKAKAVQEQEQKQAQPKVVVSPFIEKPKENSNSNSKERTYVDRRVVDDVLASKQYALERAAERELANKYGDTFIRNPISDAEAKAINSYTSGGYTKINPALRKDETPPGSFARYDKNLSKLLSRQSMPEDILVVRGIEAGNMFRDLYNSGELKPGYVLRDKAYMSTSITSGFPGTEMRIRVPKGSEALFLNAKGIKEHGSNNDENEVLLNKNAGLYLHSYTKGMSSDPDDGDILEATYVGDYDRFQKEFDGDLDRYLQSLDNQSENNSDTMSSPLPDRSEPVTVSPPPAPASDTPKVELEGFPTELTNNEEWQKLYNNGKPKRSYKYFYSHDNAKGLAEFSKQIFGRKMSEDELADLIGAADGAEVEFDYSPHTGITMVVKHPYYTQRRSIMVDSFGKGKGKPIIKNEEFFAEDGAPKGIGTQIFTTQVYNSKKAGVYRFLTDAGKAEPNEDYPKGMNGYYTWPRLGYNGSLDDLDIDHDSLRETFPDVFGDLNAFQIHDKTIQDIMKLPGGPEWWKDNGTSFTGGFNLQDDSDSMKILNAYVGAKFGKGKTNFSGTGTGKKPPAKAKEKEKSLFAEFYLPRSR
jgi:ADP-ribosyltransferase exoenzyme